MLVLAIASIYKRRLGFLCYMGIFCKCLIEPGADAFESCAKYETRLIGVAKEHLDSIGYRLVLIEGACCGVEDIDPSTQEFACISKGFAGPCRVFHKNQVHLIILIIDPELLYIVTSSRGFFQFSSLAV